MYSLLRPLLFLLPPEMAHGLVLASLRSIGGTLPSPAGWPPSEESTGGIELAGLRFANRVGIAAGFDKDGAVPVGCERLGFGFVEVGTVTPRPQPGNPKPRLFRLVEDRALINRLGFNGGGCALVVKNLTQARERGLSIPLGINIGKNKDTPLEAAAEDYLYCFDALHRFADYFTMNISSPNTPGLRELQSAQKVGELAGLLARRRDEVAAPAGADAAVHAVRRIPLFVKVDPDQTHAQVIATAEAALEAGADGIIATNTTIRRDVILRSPHGRESGGLSGRPLAERSRDTVKTLRAALGDGVPIIGVGGIDDGESARMMLDAGADLIQLYTGLVYQGPGIVRTIVRMIDEGTTQ